MFWIDDVSKKLIDTRKKKKYLITDSFTPSGKAHIGSVRGVVIHEVVKQALIDKKKEAVFQFGFDDFDPMDGFPTYLPENLKKYMGVPFNLIPSPEKGFENLGDYFARYFEKVFNAMGIYPKIVKTSVLYKDGVFDKAIKIVLQNADKIRQIYLEVSNSKKDKDWFPVSVMCPKCGKIGTTKVTKYDKEKDLVFYTCEPNMVDWAQGCGESGWISPYKGNAKLPWKAEWPAKWFTFSNDVEGEGKDHAVAGGSRDVANRIAREVFKIEPPFDIPYEHFQIGGKKMSSSKGTGAFAQDVANVIPPEVLKFLLLRTRPNRTIEFDINGDTIPLLYDEYDRCIDEYLLDPESDLARAYFYARISDGKPAKYRLRFSKLVYLLQMHRTSIENYAQKEAGRKLDKIELKELETRKKYAALWLAKYAPEKYKFEIQEKLPELAKNLTSLQKKFLANVAEIMEKSQFSGEELHQKIHEIKNEIQISPRDAFSAVYLVILGKDSGPQAGWLLASLDKEFVVKRLKELK